MPTRSSGRESILKQSPGRWILLIALVGGPALASEPAPPDELQHRIQGMEGKLRESALARKSADQARMEAERRLAESLQALEELRIAHAELERRLSDCESARTQLAEELQRQGTTNRTLYQVRPSDNLASISLRFYGRADQWRAIFEANRHLLDDPDRLTPGMTLLIP